MAENGTSGDGISVDPNTYVEVLRDQRNQALDQLAMTQAALDTVKAELLRLRKGAPPAPDASEGEAGDE